MRDLISPLRMLWRQDKLFLALLILYVFAYSWMVRVALRTLMDGQDFRWVNLLNTQLMGQDNRAFIAGNGMDGHFIVIITLAMVASALLFLLIRRPDSFTRALLFGWVLIFLGHQLTLATQLGSDDVIRGDTMGLVLPFYIIGPAQHLLLLLLAAVWFSRGGPARLARPVLPLSRRRLVSRVLYTMPVTFLLFRWGEQHGLSDQLGIVLLYIQIALLVFGIMHFELRERVEA